MQQNEKISIFARLRAFLKEGLWKIRRSDLPLLKSILLKHTRIFVLALKGFSRDKCALRASALTFYTLLSIVPVLALAFGIAKGFGFESVLEQQIFEFFQGQEEVMEQAIAFSQSMLINARGGLIAGIGLMVLFWSVIKVLSHIEGSLNDIWGVKEGRPLLRKCADYLSIAIVFPVLFIVSSSALVLVSGHIEAFTERIAVVGFISPVVLTLLNLLPVVIPILALSFIYISLPNTRVNVSAALLGGILGGVAYSIVQALYLHFQLELSSFGAVYGSFAAVPLFLIWLQTSWFIVLFGAEISFAEQHVDTYEFEPEAIKASQRLKKLLALRICSLCLDHFQKGAPPLSLPELSERTHIPRRLLREILHHLVQAKILSEVVSHRNEDKPRYQPAIDPNQLTLASVLSRFDGVGTSSLPFLRSDEMKILEQTLVAFEQEIEGANLNKPLSQLIDCAVHLPETSQKSFNKQARV